MTRNRIEKNIGNSPVRHIPADYYPQGCGYWFVIPEGMDRGKKLFFRDSIHGDGTPEHTIVLVHGNPECSYIYKDIINEIITGTGRTLRIIALDHIGFGLSDQASYEMVSMDHANNLKHLIQYLNLKGVTLVTHDWGGPIGIGAFLHAPERVDNLMITNTTVFPIPDTGYTYDNYPIKWLPWSRMPKIIPDKLWGNFAAYAIFRTPAAPWKIIGGYVQYLLKTAIDVIGKTEKPDRRLYREQFNSTANAKSSKRLVRQTSKWAAGNVYDDPALGQRDTRPFYKFIQENLKRAWGPEGRNIGVHSIAGGWDPLGKDGVIHQWIDNLPQLKGNVDVYESVSHFVEILKYKEIAIGILKLITQNELYAERREKL